MSETAMARIIFVRHGETEWNRLNKFRGRADMPLNETGKEQARKVAARLARSEVNAIFASPLARTMDTARAIGERVVRTPIPHADLLDLNYGAWEGKTPEEVERTDGKRWREWLTHPDRVMIPQGETLKALRERAFRALNELLPSQDERPVILVSHDIVGRILVCAVLDLPNDAIWRVAQDNVGITIFEKSDKRWLMRAMNDTAHLQDATVA
jgi:broad specificity phosphatase PhoE